MHKKRFQDKLGEVKGEAVPIKNSAQKAFVERLKKQVSSDDSSSNTGGADPCDDDIYSKELLKKPEADFNALFADLDDDD